MFAEVMVNLANRRLDRVFHYSVPLFLEQQVKEGMQVLVPFGPRVVDGYIVGFTSVSEVENTKDIIDIVSDEPVFNQDMLELARWMAKDYLCSLVEALHVVMPPGAKLRSKKYITLHSQISKEDFQTINHTIVKKYKKMFDFLMQARGKVEVSNLEKSFNKLDVNKFIKYLREKGLGQIHTEFQSKARKKKFKQAVLADLDTNIEEILAELSSKAPKQAEALNILADESPLSLSDLKEYGFSYNIIKELNKKGFISIEEVEELRSPFGKDEPPRYEPPKELTNDQVKALKEITASLQKGQSEIFLIHGVTGSGKTEIYLQAIEKTLAQGKQAIFLVPEISLTPQMVARFRGRFGDEVAILHSALSHGERFDQWRQIQAGKLRVVIGARSAIFAPVPSLGLVILDEEHESTYKQEENPKYHAREVAIIRAEKSGCPVLLGSATPSLESFTKAKEGKYRLISMPNRVDDRPMPTVEVVDLRQEMEAGNRSIFSTLLKQEINSALARKEQVILFLNRRGFSTFVVCRDCGFVVKCRNCDVSMTYHAFGERMVCHYCDYKLSAPRICPVCGSKYIRYFGLGTQKVEDEISKHFPQARLLRMDVDSTGRKGAHEKILTAFAKGEADILIGTQMIAKGLDFPRVTLVGVITADTSLNLPDFRSGEKTFQLLTQVAGRAGRGELPGTVIIQSYSPEHYSIQSSREHDYLSFYQLEIIAREEMEYPPFCQLLRIVTSGSDENRVIQAIHRLADNLQTELRKHDLGINRPLLGPAPAPLLKVRNKYRWQLCIKARDRNIYNTLLKEALFTPRLREQFSDIRFNVEIDPQSLI